MKHITLILLLTAFFTTMKAQDRMLVHLKNGQTVAYSISEIKKVEIEGTQKSGIEGKAIDLGLSVLWASHNLGASTASEAGDIFSHEAALTSGSLWNDGWRLPTEEEWQELSERCNWSWTMLNGINGRMVTGPSGQTIFLPTTGLAVNNEVHVAGCMGIYWSASTTSETAANASGVYFDSANIFVMGFPLTNTHTVRLVKDNK